MNKTILKPRSEFSFSLPEMKEGDVLMHFAPRPQGNVRYVESNINKFEIYTEPHWIECGMMEKGLLHDLDSINEHLDEISCYESLEGYSCVKEKAITPKDFDSIEHGAKRLIYTLYRRLKYDSFLEINLVGLSHESMTSLFRYALDTHDKYPVTSYLFVLYVDDVFYNTIENPTMVVSEENINDVFSFLETIFSYNRNEVESRNFSSKTIRKEFIVCKWYAKLKRKIIELINRIK